MRVCDGDGAIGRQVQINVAGRLAGHEAENPAALAEALSSIVELGAVQTDTDTPSWIIGMQVVFQYQPLVLVLWLGLFVPVQSR